MSRATKSSSSATARCGGPASGCGPAVPSGVTRAGLFCNEDEAAQLWGLSANGLALARARGEFKGAYKVAGRRILYSRLAPALSALGLRTPADLGAFVASAGWNIDDLMRFLGVDVDMTKP